MSALPELGPVVEVEWVDSAGHGEWASPEDVHDLLDNLTCRSVGYLLADDERGVLLALGAGAVGQYLSTMAIPRRAVVSMVTVVTDALHAARSEDEALADATLR